MNKTKLSVRSDLSTTGRKLLKTIIRQIRSKGFAAEKPETFLGYKDACLRLNLASPDINIHWGRLLQHHGLNELNEWTKRHELPRITGLIVHKGDASDRQYWPGADYFRSNGREDMDLTWWKQQVSRAVSEDWLQYLQGPATGTKGLVSPTGEVNHRYWVVSPNVKFDEKSVGDWRAASVRESAAFMGWEPNDHDHAQIGAKFAGTVADGIVPGDVILIARRHLHQPEIVGFGVVHGKYATSLKGFTPPQEFGSLRLLSPFQAWSGVPKGIPLIDVLQHTMALVQLHPERGGAAKSVCEWMETKLGSSQVKQHTTATKITVEDLPENDELDYEIKTKAQVLRARKIEAQLVEQYRTWIEKQDRRLSVAKYGGLRCDCYERARQNLIEAKASSSREHVRMAVGQLLDYEFQGRKSLGKLHKAVLVPEKLGPQILAWLQDLQISVIYRQGPSFIDNANGQFT